jgi:hypothetical protein
MAGPPAAVYVGRCFLFRGGRERRKLMADNIVRMPASRGTTLDPKTAHAYTELLAQTICLLDKQIERAKELAGADPAHYFLRAIEAHIVDKLDARLKLQGNQS